MCRQQRSRWGGRFDVLGRLQGSGDWADLAIDEQDTAVGASADSGTGPEAEADVDDQAAVVGGKADAAMAEDIALPAACAGTLSAGRTAAKAVKLPYNLRKPLHKQRDLQRRAREKKRLLKQPLEQWEMDACHPEIHVIAPKCGVYYVETQGHGVWGEACGVVGAASHLADPLTPPVTLTAELRLPRFLSCKLTLVM
eukprot:XP_001691497.1 predicted protein [Chlamydomonas reinhardtii]